MSTYLSLTEIPGPGTTRPALSSLHGGGPEPERARTTASPARCEGLWIRSPPNDRDLAGPGRGSCRIGSLFA